MARPAFTHDGKMKPAGEAPGLKAAVFEGPMGPRDLDKESGAPERPCARCRRPFRPTRRSAILCYPCFKSGADADSRGVPVM